MTGTTKTTPEQRIASHLRDALLELEKLEPTREVMDKLGKELQSLAPAQPSAPLERWKRAAYKMLPRLLY